MVPLGSRPDNSDPLYRDRILDASNPFLQKKGDPLPLPGDASELDLSVHSFSSAVTLEKDLSGATKQSSESVPQIVESDSNLDSYIKVALKSPGFWSGVGSSVVCLGKSNFGVLAFLGLTLLSLRNEVRANSSLQKPTDVQSPDKPSSGLKGLMRMLIQSPGFNLTASALSWVASAAESLTRGNIVTPIVYTSFAIGSASAAGIMNRGAAPINREQPALERDVRSLWEKLPKVLRNTLQNPAPWYAAGNVLLTLSSVGLASLSTLSIASFAAVSGVALASAATAVGLWPLLARKEESQPSGNASYIAAGSSVLFSVANFISGNLPVATASLTWGMSNFLLGRRLDSLNAK